MKSALVLGAGGFIGSHMVRRLKSEGYKVRGVDLKYPEFSATEADDFLIADLRIRENVTKALSDFEGKKFDEIYSMCAKNYRILENFENLSLEQEYKKIVNVH